jgi:rhodanese-related sulfurtransferase
MADAPRITVDELRKRMEGGEDFTILDTRNPKEWAESDSILPEARRVSLDRWEEALPSIPMDRPIVAYCT